MLQRRAWRIDVLVCPRCGGPMRMIALIQDPLVARTILEHLGLPARAPPRGRAVWQGHDERPLHEGPLVNTPDAADLDW